MNIIEYHSAVVKFKEELGKQLNSDSELALLSAVIALITTAIAAYPNSISESLQEETITWQFKEDGIFLPNLECEDKTPDHFVPQLVFSTNSKTGTEKLSINMHPRMPIGSFGFDTVVWEREKESIFLLKEERVTVTPDGKNALSGYIQIETNLIKSKNH